MEGIRLTRAAEKVSGLFHWQKLPRTCTVLTNGSIAFGKSKFDAHGGGGGLINGVYHHSFNAHKSLWIKFKVTCIVYTQEEAV